MVGLHRTISNFAGIRSITTVVEVWKFDSVYLVVHNTNVLAALARLTSDVLNIALIVWARRYTAFRETIQHRLFNRNTLRRWLQQQECPTDNSICSFLFCLLLRGVLREATEIEFTYTN
jgi:hypothetical protein